MSKPGVVRVLVAEDSTTTRTLLVTMLRSDPVIEVVGEAANGAQAVEMTARLRPSLVMMDIHMPVMDGFEATKRIMIEAPTPVVIVTAAANARDVEMGLRAVQLGALTVLPKPPAPGTPGFDAAARRLLALVKALAEVKVVRRRRTAAERPATPPPSRASPVTASVDVVAIGASTGGPAALYRLLEHMPRETAVPILVVQHIAPGFAPGLVAWLGSGTPLPVKLAEEGEKPAPGTIYVARDDRHLEVSPQRRLVLTEAARANGFRPSASVLFTSVAEAFRARSVGVILTGMGQDGLDGLRALRRAGGQVLAQDEASSVVFGMPGVVVAEGLADVVAPVEDLALHLSVLVTGGSS